MRKEWVDLRDSTLHDWDKEIGRPIDGDKNVKYPNGSVLMFRHGEDLNALKNTNLGGALMVQAEEHNEDDFWFLNGRLRRQEGTRQLRLECNYDGHNWIYRLFNEQKVGSLITTNTFDNEKNLPPDYIPNLKLLPKRLQDRHLYGSDVDTEGLVYDEFNETRHYIEPFVIPDTWERGFGLDHGFRNPTAVLWYAIDYDGVIYIYDEHYEKEKPISYHAEQIKPRGIFNGLCDPSVFNRTQSRQERIFSIADEYADYGIILRPAFKTKEEATINRVNEFFKQDKIKIFKNCSNTYREVGNWKWKALKPGSEHNDKEEPMDLDNHTCDVIKYIVASRISATARTEKPLYGERSLAAHLERLEESKQREFV
jgi:PBSX family phage terminase large subunit